MWATFNDTGYPIVEVHMEGTIESDEEFEQFLQEWRDLYIRERDFVFIFDTRKVGMVSMKYAFRMASFIKELKELDRQYLKRSAIIVGNWWVKILLKLIFVLQSPVCPIEYHTSEYTINLERLLDCANRRYLEALR